MKLTKVQVEAAPLCETCYDYVDDCKVVLVDGEWVHIENGLARCPGQEDDDTDDTAAPLTSPDNGRALTARHYVIGFDGAGHEILGEAVTHANYYGIP